MPNTVADMQSVRRRSQQRTRACTRASRREAVERIEAYIRLHPDTALPLSELCRIVGLSERSLRNAFYEVRGAAPKRCLQDERLLEVRRALSTPVRRQTTVTDVAMENGFFELGRFARAYKEMFGEAPSATLRGAISNRPLQSAARVSENRNVCRP
jgi:AraC family ethanolamine operon transcriptional activator